MSDPEVLASPQAITAQKMHTEHHDTGQAMSERSADLQAIAGQIKNAREAADWSQHELADRAGVSKPSVARIEAGGDVNTATLRKITEALDLGLRVDADGE